MDPAKSDPGRKNHDFPVVLLEESRQPSVIARNVAASLVVHIFLAAGLWSLPEVTPPARRGPAILPDVRNAVKLVAPRFTDLTQKDPNTSKPSRSIDVRSAVSSPQQARLTVPTTTPAPSPPAPPPSPAPTPPSQVIEPPKIEVAVNSGLPQGGAMPQLPPAPPKTQEKNPEKPQEKQKMAFETVASASVRSPSQNPAITLPSNSVTDMGRRSASSPGGGVTVGDEIDPLRDQGAPGQAPAPGRMGSNLQLLSDTQGVDFKPYLVQILAAVRYNWMSVIPESARLGRKGVVVVQFIIDREGKVPKLVIASPSGTVALDRAAVAGVSMSNPFPALPAGYKSDEVRLQLAFSYNMAK